MALASFPSAMLAKGASEEPQHSVYWTVNTSPPRLGYSQYKKKIKEGLDKQ